MNQSKSFLNKHKFNNNKIKNKKDINSNIDKINPLGYIKTSGNIEIENNKRIKHYYTKNEKINKNKNKNKKKNNNEDIINKHKKNKSLNYSALPSSSFINSSYKSKLLSNSYFFQKHFYNQRNNESNSNNINISNISRNKSNSNNEIDNKKNLSIKINKNNIKKDFLIFDESNISQNNKIENNNNCISLEELFDKELKIKKFKNPEEFHFLYIKFIQSGKEISHNFEKEYFK